MPGLEGLRLDALVEPTVTVLAGVLPDVLHPDGRPFNAQEFVLLHKYREEFDSPSPLH